MNPQTVPVPIVGVVEHTLKASKLATIERYALLVFAIVGDLALAAGSIVGQLSPNDAAKYGTVLSIFGLLGHGIQHGVPAAAKALGQPAPNDGAFADDSQAAAVDLAQQASDLLEHIKVQAPTTMAAAIADAKALEPAAEDIAQDEPIFAKAVDDVEEAASPPPADTSAPAELVDIAPPEPAVTPAPAPGPVMPAQP